MRATIPVLTERGKVEWRRATQRTVAGTALLGPTRFPVGDLEPVPRSGEGIAQLPKESDWPPFVGWRVFRC